MSESKFTPGPWRLLPPSVGADANWHVTDAGDTFVAHVFGFAHGVTEQSHINARLIAAAPELYEALRKAISNLEMAEVNSYAFEGDDDPEYIGAKEAWQRDIEFFRAVLLKATPEQSE